MSIDYREGKRRDKGAEWRVESGEWRLRKLNYKQSAHNNFPLRVKGPTL